MATKRKPVLPADVDLDLESVRARPGGAKPQPAFHEAPAATSSSPQLKQNAINMTVYLLRDDHRRLRMVAAAEETSVQTLVLDGIDAVLRQRKMEPVTRWETRRKPR